MHIGEESTADREAVTYEIYLRLYEAQKLYPAKTLRTVLSELFYADPFAWRAVGITRAALNAYREAGRRKIKGIERAHLTDRHKMVAHILDRETPMSQEELFSYWRNEDRVIISLKSENQSNQLGDWIPFQNDRASYFTRLGIGFRYKYEIEGEMLRRLSEDMADISTATRSSFRTMPLPDRREDLKMSLQYSLNDYNKIKAGLVPNDMDDRWFIFFEEGWLYLYRSWSGFCVYGARFEDTPTGGFLSKAWVNADKEQYNPSEPGEEAQLLENLIAELLLSRRREPMA